MTPLGGPWSRFVNPFSAHVLALPPGMLVVFVVWTLVWKGLALWRAARAGQPGWFVAMLIINTAGLLEIVYLVFVAPRHAPVLAQEACGPLSGAPSPADGRDARR